MQRILHRIGAALRRIVGAPDYERYLAHMRACHPAVEPQSEAQFMAARLADRYNRPGAKCC